MTADQNVAAAGSGVTQDALGNPTTTPLKYAQVAFLYSARMFGLAKDYAFPEGSNVSSSRWDQITTLAKILTRKYTGADGNTYDVFDMLALNTKWILSQNLHLADNEVDSVNYKAPTA